MPESLGDFAEEGNGSFEGVNCSLWAREKDSVNLEKRTRSAGTEKATVIQEFVWVEGA